MLKRKRGNFDRNFFIALGKDVEEAAKQALEEGAKDVATEMKLRIHEVSGDLAKSVHLVKWDKGRKIRILADAKDKKGIAYGQFVEFGKRKNPFMYPAFDAKADSVKQRIIEAIRKGCEKHAINR